MVMDLVSTVKIFDDPILTVGCGKTGAKNDRQSRLHIESITFAHTATRNPTVLER